MKTSLSALAMLVLLVTAARVDARELRNHYTVLNRADHTPAFEVTRIIETSSSRSTHTYLIADADGPYLRIDIVSDYANRNATKSYALLRQSRARASIRFDLPAPKKAKPKSTKEAATPAPAPCPRRPRDEKRSCAIIRSSSTYRSRW